MLENIIAALVGTLNGVSQSVMAVSFGFALVPSSLAFLVGVISCLVFQSSVPISFQADTIIMAGRMGHTRQERLTIVFIAGIAMMLIGAFGLLDDIVRFAGMRVTTAMMCGVSIILAKVAFDMAKENFKVASTSIALAVIMYMLTQELVYTFAISVIGSTIVYHLPDKNKIKVAIMPMAFEKFQLQKPVFNFNVLRGVLALVCMTIGGNIAFTKISGIISNTTENSDYVSIYSGLADVLSSMFGGSPIAIILSPTSATPNPILSTVLLMSFMGVLLATGLVSRISKHIPTSATAGTLFVLGIFVSLPGSLQVTFANATKAESLAGSVAMIVTAMVDPFVGLLAGIIINLLAIPLGF